MRLGKIVAEDKLPGNRERREKLGLPWLVYSSSQYALGDALAAVQDVTERDVKICLWRGRKVPKEVVIIGKFTGDPDDAELPFYTIPDAAQPESPESAGVRPNRAATGERVLVKLASRLIRLEHQLAIWRALTIISLMGLVAVWTLLLLVVYRIVG